MTGLKIEQSKMYISKINIDNFKCFNGKFSLNLNSGANILVGNNEAGKSTILEAIHLALCGILNGRYLRNELLSQYLFNKIVEKEYISSLVTKSPLQPPIIRIELFFAGDKSQEFALLYGNGNSEKSDECGISFCIEFDEQYQAEYAELLKTDSIKSIPIEYYKISLKSFARDSITTRSIPIKSALIDSASFRIQNGSDMYISKIIRENLENKEKVEISQAHRQMKEIFMATDSVKKINEKINANANITDKQVEISVDLATQNAWETSLMTYLDEIPFHYIGKGEQCVIKTNLALSHKKSKEASIILMEEPENHLSHSKLNELLSRISNNLENKQVIVSTHSSFVANKLGLAHLIFINNFKSTKLNELASDTTNFFSKLAGYDTLRFILCKAVILVEGPSDELVIQKAYMKNNGNVLPIHNGIEVISVSTSFLRFLQIATRIDIKVTVVTDNDGNIEALNKKYADYIGDKKISNIKICFDTTVDTGDNSKIKYNTLEPKLLKANNLDLFNKIFNQNFDTNEKMNLYMQENKTECALKIFETDETISFPQYILDAISNYEN